MFAHQDTRGRVEIAFTDRHRETGGGPSASLDLGRGGEDHLHEARENHDVVAHAAARGHEATGSNPVELPDGAGLPVTVTMRQVHGADVHVADRDWLRATRDGGADAPVADALVTDVPGVLLLVRVADCVPVLLADPTAGVVAAVHAGRPGMAAGVVPATVAVMRERGATDLLAWVGPHVCGACYEVPDEMRAQVSAVVPASYAETSWGTPALDIGAGVEAQLRQAGVETVLSSARCTLEDDDLYSYRRQGAAAGRLGGLVWMRP